MIFFHKFKLKVWPRNVDLSGQADFTFTAGSWAFAIYKHTTWGRIYLLGIKVWMQTDPGGAAPFCRRLDQPRLDTEVLSSIWGGFITKRTRPLWVATPTSSPLVPIHSFLTRLFGRVRLCRATRWNNKPGEVSFICSTNVYTALSLPLSPGGFACSITLPLTRSLSLPHSFTLCLCCS